MRKATGAAALDQILPRKEARGVQSIEVGGRILAALAEASCPMMLKDLAALAGIAPAQAHAYLLSYRRIGLVEQEEATGRYQFGPLALDLAIGRMTDLNPDLIATEIAQDLSQRSGMTVAIVAWGAFGPGVIALVEGQHQIHMNTRAGTIYSLTGTVSGRVFAAHMPERIVRDMLRLQARPDIRSGIVGQLHDYRVSEMEEIRRKGYASFDPLPVPGVAAISAPVFDDVGGIRLALTMISSAKRLGPEGLAPQAPTLVAAARHLSQQLGHDPAAR
ncbi:IclR family transcriptional regulator [Tabrizicola sp.]|uniref:IclR family transcriptional regulator n=1 Tax=Tabrizicola sp. TaxID=2005166 RepID=UPI002FDD082A